MILLVWFHFLSACFPGSLTQNGDGLAGTKWESKLAEGCTDSLLFKTGQRIREYSCEAGEWYIGSYTLSKDTVIASYVSDSEGGLKQRWRVSYLYRDSLLTPIRSQGYSHGRWEKPEPITTPGYVFKKTRK